MSDSRGYTFRYAIRMPNGDLYQHPQAQQPAVDYGVSSPMRDMWSMLGMATTPTATKPVDPGPAIFDNSKAAEALLNDIRSRAAAVGVTHWGGTVVTQLCTPFTSGDPEREFWPQVVEWLRAQGMDA